MDFIREIGEGAFGEVYEVEVDGERRAAKTCKAKKNIDKIEKETAQLSRVNHINIVTVFGLQLHENVPYLIMEYMEGGSMKDLLRSAHFKLTDVIIWFSQVAAGLAYLHAMTPQPILHRDIKPHNILMSGDLQVAKIGDFDTSRDLASTMTNFIGTALYMAPEVFDSKKYTEKCDVYSFAISLWEMLARKRPFAERRTAEQILMAAHEGERPSFNGLRCHNLLIDLIRFCWHKDPTKRPVMQIVFKVLRHTLKLYKQFEMSTDVLAGNVVEHLDEQKVLSAERDIRDFMINVQRKNTEMDKHFCKEWNWHFFFALYKFIGIGIVDDSKYNGEIYEDEWNSIIKAVSSMGEEIRYNQQESILTTMSLLRNSVKIMLFENKRLLELYKIAIAEIGEVYPGAQLRVIDAEDLRVGTEATALLPNEPSDPEAILNMLWESNPHVPIDDWKVLEIEECGQSQIQVIFQLDNEWKDEKRILNYGLNMVRLSVIQFHEEWLESCPDDIIIAESCPDDTEEAKEVKPKFLRKVLDYFD